MTFTSAMRALRRKWLTVLAGLLIGLAVAGTVSLVLPRSYASSASVYVAGVDNAQSPGSDYYANSLLFVQRIASYHDLVISDRVLGPAGRESGMPLDAHHVSVGGAATSTVLQITTTEDEPGRAAIAANAVATQFIGALSELERPRGAAGPPAVTASIISAGLPQPVAVAPRTGVNLLLGAVVGLAAAAAFVLARALKDTTIGTAGALRSACGATVWGVVPRVAARRRPVLGAGDEGFDEAVRRVRAHLTEGVPAGGRVITVSAPMPGAGTSTIVQALADALADRHRVVVVDANLRRPASTARYDLAESPGLAEVVAGTASLGDAVQLTDGPDVLTSGGRPKDPGELLSATETAQLLTALRERYDVVLVDGPPLVPVVDAALIAARSDGVLMVAREHVTDEPHVRSAAATLEQFGARVLGAVLTMSGDTPPGYESALPPGAVSETTKPSSTRVVNPA